MSAETKAVVTVSEMARMVGLSRARFYQLQKAGVFPAPVYNPATKRPFYDESLQEVCLEVRRKNCGANGKPVLFYARYRSSVPIKPKKRPGPPITKGRDKSIVALLDGLNSLGLTTATAAQVEAVTKEVYPTGTDGIDQGEVLRKVFLELRRRNSGDNVGR
jgi:hypothetical protein